MASIGSDKNGRRRILFVSAGDGRRRTIRLGKMTVKEAEVLKTKIEALVTAEITGSMKDETARWLADLPDLLHGRLVAVGLARPRVVAPVAPPLTLGAWLADYMQTRTDLKASTVQTVRQAIGYLTAFFGKDKPLSAITAGDADAWAQALTGRGLAQNTVRKRSGQAKTVFKAAVRKGLLSANPFADLKANVRGNRDKPFVSRAVAQKVLDACPDTQWRLIFALSRFGGLRCPSEHLALRWGDINWGEGRMTVHSPKTERIAGHESRIVPLFPELLPHLQEAFDAAEPGTEYVVARRLPNGAALNLHRGLRRIIAKAGLKPWPRLFHNLRATRETELAKQWPLHVVCAWIGNSEAVAKEFYLSVTEDDFRRAAQNPAQYQDDSPVSGVTARKEKTADGQEQAESPQNRAGLPDDSESYTNVRKAEKSLPDLGNLYATLVAEIARDSEQLKVRAETGGAAVPKDWRHPKQAAADALKALIDRAKTAPAPAAAILSAPSASRPG